MTQTWRATVSYANTAPEITDDQADALVHHLPGFAVVHHDGRQIHLSMDVQASTLRKAEDEAHKAARTAYAAAFDVVGTEVGVRILTEEDHERELVAPSALDLVGVADIGEMAGVTRQRAQQWTEQPSFPKPVATPKSGPVFTRKSVEKWLEANPRRTGRPPKVERAAA